MSFEVPRIVKDIIDLPVTKRDSFFQYTRDCLNNQLSVGLCNALLAGLDVLGRSIVSDLEKEQFASYGSLRELPLLRAEIDLALCDFLADELRAARRSIVARAMESFKSGDMSVTDFVDLAVLPMLSRSWLTMAFYEPAVGPQSNDVQLWREQMPPFDGAPEIFLPPDERQGLRESLLSACAHRNLRKPISLLLCILDTLRDWELGGASRVTAAYLNTTYRLSCTSRLSLEVPIVLVRLDQSKWKSGHILRALPVPFATQCTNAIFMASLLTAMTQVNASFGGTYAPPDILGLLIADYPGGVFCPGEASCAVPDGRCTAQAEVSRQFEGPSAGPSFGVLFSSHALGLEMLPHRYATARLETGGQIMTLSTRSREDRDFYLEAKGRTIALLAHVAGAMDVIVNEGDLLALRTGAQQFQREIEKHVQQTSWAPPGDGCAVSWRAVSSLGDSLHCMLRIYGDLIDELTGEAYTPNCLATAAARRILSDDEVDRWVISVSAPRDGVDSVRNSFEMNLARELYRLTSRSGPITVPLCRSLLSLYQSYIRHPSNTTLVLGKAVAGVAGFEQTPNSRIVQVERDLYEGNLMLILKSHVRVDEEDDTIVQREYNRIEELIGVLKGTNNDRWRVKRIVIVIRTELNGSSERISDLLSRHGFWEYDPKDDDPVVGHSKISVCRAEPEGG